MYEDNLLRFTQFIEIMKFTLSVINFAKRCVFSLFLKLVSFVQVLMSFGRAFHHLGPTVAIDLSATLVLVLGTMNQISLDELNL